MKETKEIRMEKGKPYPLGWTENAGWQRQSRSSAGTQQRVRGPSVSQKRRCAQTAGISGRRPNRKNLLHEAVGLDAQEYEYNFYCGEEVITDPKARRICGNEKWGKKISPSLRGDSTEDAFDWKNDRRPQIPYENSIFYQLHVRGIHEAHVFRRDGERDVRWSGREDSLFKIAAGNGQWSCAGVCSQNWKR